MAPQTTVFLGLGSNLGDRAAHLAAACTALETLGTVTGRSRLYETAPLYVTDQPAFLNMAVALETAYAPRDLLARLKALELAQGRQETRRYGPRVLDLDILLYDTVVMESEFLTLPHPRLPERRFVLVPLVELAAEVVHPVLRLTMRALLDRLPDHGDVVAYEH